MAINGSNPRRLHCPSGKGCNYCFPRKNPNSYMSKPINDKRKIDSMKDKENEGTSFLGDEERLSG